MSDFTDDIWADESDYRHHKPTRSKGATMAKAEPKKTNKLITPVFRGSYCNLVTPRAIEEGKDPEYSIQIVLSKKDQKASAFVSQLRKAILSCAQEKFGQPTPEARLKHFPIKDGDAQDDESKHGHWLISAHNKRRPGAIDKAGNKLEFSDDLYSGAWYVVSISPWAWNHKTGGKGVSLNLHNVMKMKDDEAFTSVAKPEEDFADLIGQSDDDGSASSNPADEDDLL